VNSYVSWYDNTGKLTTETIANRSQAVARQSEIERTLQEENYVDPAVAELTVTEAADEWLDSLRDLRTSAWLKYRGLLDRHVLPRWGDSTLNEMFHADEDIKVWVTDLFKSKDDSGSGLRASDIRAVYLILAMVLKSYVSNEPREPHLQGERPRAAQVPTRPPRLPVGGQPGGSYRPPVAE
jgi:hypothetical protein